MPLSRTVVSYKKLDAKKVLATAERLHSRIEERFPGSGLGQVVAEICTVARHTVPRTEWIQKPNYPLRLGAGLLILAILWVLGKTVLALNLAPPQEFSSFIQAVEATVSTTVFLGAGALFLVTWDTRLKRHRALQALYELRALAHIVDMHQLTKDPERLLGQGRDTPSSPPRMMKMFELNRYLNYCSEALSLLSKVAALYAQGLHDPVVLESVDEMEDLTTGLSRNIWQKIILLNGLRIVQSEDLPAKNQAPGPVQAEEGGLF